VNLAFATIWMRLLECFARLCEIFTAVVSSVTEVWARGENFAEGGPVFTVGSPLSHTEEKSSETVVNPDGDVYCTLKLKITGKHPKQRKKTKTYWKPKKL